jgi:hypothetical protein
MATGVGVPAGVVLPCAAPSSGLAPFCEVGAGACPDVESSTAALDSKCFRVGCFFEFDTAVRARQWSAAGKTCEAGQGVLSLRVGDSVSRDWNLSEEDVMREEVPERTNV